METGYLVTKLMQIGAFNFFYKCSKCKELMKNISSEKSHR